MANNEHEEGAGMVQTDREVLDDLRRTIANLNCSLDEARAVNAIKKVNEIKAEVQLLRDEIRAVQEINEKRWQKAWIYIRARSSGDKQANAVYDKLMKELGEE